MGKLLKVVLVFIVVIGALIASKNIIAQIAIEKGVKAATGFPIEIKKIDIDLISGHIVIIDPLLIIPKRKLPRRADNPA